MPIDIRVALDWTPNTLHTGLFVALDQGFYRDCGLNVILISPDQDNYQETPARALSLGKVDFALCPAESIIAYRTSRNPVSLQGIYAILAKDASSICTLASSNIDRPKDLDGRIYGSYQARYEDEIVKAMIRNDGGQGILSVVYPDKLNIWNALLGKSGGEKESKQVSIDATWIFGPWEGVQARHEGLKLREFKMSDFQIPYGYSPIIALNEEANNLDTHTVMAFVEATKRGYMYTATLNESATAEAIISTMLPRVSPYLSSQVKDQRSFLIESQAALNEYYSVGDPFGYMQSSKWQAFVQFLKTENLLSEDELQTIDQGSKLYTNKFVEQSK